MLQRLRVKLIVLWLAFAALLVTTTNVIAFRTALDAQFQQLRNTLTAIATTGALAVDGDAHARIPPSPSSESLPAYRELVHTLRAIRDANPSIRYVYTLVPSEDSTQWHYVGDAEEYESSYLGEHYNASRYPAMLAAVTRPSADPQLTYDEWGALLSSYAPIKNSKGETVAVLGIDMSGDQVVRTQGALRHWHILMLIISLATVLLLGFLIAQWITRPLRHLLQGTQRIGQGDLTYRVPVTSQDEVGLLAQAFNHMTELLAASTQELQEHVLSTIQSLSMALEAKDRFTRGHSERVNHYAVKIAQAMKVHSRQIDIIRKFSRLHDVGKIGVREDILLKPSTLTAEEYEVIKRHPEVGYKILAPLKLPQEALDIVRYHHERLDGRGYPTGIQGEQIPMLVAIVSVADAFDAMTAHRPYRQQPLAFVKAIEEMQQHIGTQFRAEVVDALVQILRQEEKLG